MVSIDDVTYRLHIQVCDVFTMIIVQADKIDVVVTQSRMQGFKRIC